MYTDGTGLQIHSIQGGSDNTAPFPHNHPYINSCKLQLDEISTAATYVGMHGYVGMVLCYHCHLV